MVDTSIPEGEKSQVGQLTLVETTPQELVSVPDGPVAGKKAPTRSRIRGTRARAAGVRTRAARPAKRVVASLRLTAGKRPASKPRPERSFEEAVREQLERLAAELIALLRKEITGELLGFLAAEV